jgi:hypothetical protein
VLLATVLLAVSVGEGLAQGLSPQPRPKGSPGESPDESPDESPEESKRLQAPTRPPVRFLLYSISHSGTHFVKHPFDKVPGKCSALRLACRLPMLCLWPSPRRASSCDFHCRSSGAPGRCRL